MKFKCIKGGRVLKLIKTTILSLFFILPLSFANAFGEKGAPKKVHCTGTLYLAKEAISQRTDINELLANNDIRLLGSINPFCEKYEGDKSGVCDATIAHSNLYLRYVFNTQNGSVTIKDNVTGQSAWSGWTNQYELTESGYLATTVWLMNENGGLLGDPRAFGIEMTCHAYSSEWQQQ